MSDGDKSQSCLCAFFFYRSLRRADREMFRRVAGNEFVVQFQVSALHEHFNLVVHTLLLRNDVTERGEGDSVGRILPLTLPSALELKK